MQADTHNVFANGVIFIIFSSVTLVEKRLFWSITLPLITILPSLFFNIVSINSLHLDGTVGVGFGATLAIYIQSKKYNNSLLTFILIAPILFILPNIKEVGYWLSFIIIFIIVVNRLVIDKNYHHIRELFVLSLLPILGKILWGLYLNKVDIITNDASGRSFLQLPFVSIIKLTTLKMIGVDHHWTSIEIFSIIKLMMWKCLPYFYSHTMVYTYVIITMSIFFIRNYNPNSLKEFIRLLILLFIGLCLYIIFRFELYLTLFLKVEALNIASYERYFGSYTIAFSFCAISFIKNILDKIQLKSLKDKILYYVFSTSALIIAIISFQRINYQLSLSSDPYYFITRQDLIKDLIKKGLNDNLQFKEHNLNILDCYIYRYLEAPYSNADKVNKCLNDVKQK